MNSSIMLSLIWLACVGLGMANLFENDAASSSAYIAAALVVAAINVKGKP